MKASTFKNRSARKLLVAISLLIVTITATALTFPIKRYGVAQAECIGCEICVEIAPELFMLNEEEGVVYPLKDSVEGGDVSLVRAAQSECPVGAIWTNY